MTCRDVQSVLEPFVDGELRGDQMREVARHLATCSPCEGVTIELEHVQKALREAVIGAAGHVDPTAAWAALAAQLDAAPTLTSRVRTFIESLQIPRIPMPVLVGGAAVALAALLLWREGEQIPGDPGGGQQLASQTARIDQLEAPGNVRVWNAPETGATVIWVDEEGLSVEHLDP
jgi:anti-sigma factor RsiW